VDFAASSLTAQLRVFLGWNRSGYQYEIFLRLSHTINGGFTANGNLQNQLINCRGHGVSLMIVKTGLSFGIATSGGPYQGHMVVD